MVSIRQVIHRLETYRSLLPLYANRFRVSSVHEETRRIEAAIAFLYNQLNNDK